MTEQSKTDPEEMGINITKLKPTMPGGFALTEDGFYSKLVRYIHDRDLVDLDGEFLDDVELLPKQPNEIYLGKLTVFETQMFAIAMLAQEIIQDTMIEAQAQTAEAAARMLRQQKHNPQNEVPEDNPLSKDDQEYLNELACVFHLASAAYEFSARSRFDVFDTPLIVRESFTAYRANTGAT